MSGDSEALRKRVVVVGEDDDSEGLFLSEPPTAALRKIQQRWKEEPIARLRNYLVNRMNWSKPDEEKIATESEQKVTSLVR